MILRVARKEVTEMFREGRFRVLSAVVLAVSLVALLAGWRQYADLSRQHRLAQQSTRDQWLAPPAKNPHSATHYGVYAFKPISQLATWIRVSVPTWGSRSGSKRTSRTS